MKRVSMVALLVVEVIVLLFLTTPGHSQVKTPAAVPAAEQPGDVELQAKIIPLPKLKPDVELALLKIRLDLTAIALREAQIIDSVNNEYPVLETRKPMLQSELENRLKSALKDSDIDEKLYEIDPKTFGVKKRATPPPAAPPAETK